APSSAESFIAAGKAWLKTTLTHPLLTDANKKFGTAIYLHFNFNHYERTGELKAWPGWDTLTTFGLSRTTINESAGRLEHFQLLDVRRGRYDRAARRREGNEYFARLPSRPQRTEFVPCPYPQGTDFVPCQPENPNDSYQGKNPAPCGVWTVKGEYRKGESSLSVEVPEKAKEGLPREGKQEEPKPEKISFERYSDAMAESRKRRAAFKRPAALNGGSQ